MPGEPALLLRCGRVFDPLREELRGPLEILVQNGMIAAIGEPLPARLPARRVDLSDATVLPGLIDLDADALPHAPGDAGEAGCSLTLFHALGRLRSRLKDGFTTLRVTGGADRRWSLLDLRQAIEEDLAPGPRLLVAPHVIDDFLAADEVVRAVERERRNGADWIAFGRTRPTVEQLNRVMTAARSTPVGVTVIESKQIRWAVLAGARSVEVACTLDREAVRLLAAAGTFVVPRDGFVVPTTQRLRLGFGSRLSGGISALIAIGCSPHRALRAATEVGAQCLGSDSSGAITVGARADLVAVPGDPLADIDLLQQDTVVIKRGVVVHAPTVAH